MGIRPAEAADRASVETIVQTASCVQAIGEPTGADYAELISSGRVYVLENGGIDAMIVLDAADGELLVENVAVRPARRGRGLGRRLMTFAEFRARSLGLRALRLSANEKMAADIGLYQSLGYREIERAAVDGRHVVWMTKEL